MKKLKVDPRKQLRYVSEGNSPNLKPQVIKEDKLSDNNEWVMENFPLGPGSLIVFVIMALIIVVTSSLAVFFNGQYRDANSKIECYKGIQRCDKDIREIQEKIIADKDKKIKDLRGALTRSSKRIEVNGEVILYMERK